MHAGEISQRGSLPNPVYLLLDQKELDFERAQDAARDLAKKLYWDPMLLSWFDKKEGKYSPKDAICATEDKLGWVEYAKSRGGDFSVDINYEDYVFIFRGGEEKP